MAPDTQQAHKPNSTFRVDVQLHELLVQKKGRPNRCFRIPSNLRPFPTRYFLPGRNW